MITELEDSNRCLLSSTGIRCIMHHSCGSQLQDAVVKCLWGLWVDVTSYVPHDKRDSSDYPAVHAVLRVQLTPAYARLKWGEVSSSKSQCELDEQYHPMTILAGRCVLKPNEMKGSSSLVSVRLIRSSIDNHTNGGYP